MMQYKTLPIRPFSDTKMKYLQNDDGICIKLHRAFRTHISQLVRTCADRGDLHKTAKFDHPSNNLSRDIVLTEWFLSTKCVRSE